MSEDVHLAEAGPATRARLQEQLNYWHLQAKDAQAALRAAEAEAARLRAIASLVIEAWAELEDPLPIETDLAALGIALGETSAGKELLAELAAAQAAIDQARRGFGTQEDIERGHAFDPVALCAAIRRYDAAVTTQRSDPPATSQV